MLLPVYKVVITDLFHMFCRNAAPDEVPVVEASDVLDGFPCLSGRDQTESRSVGLVESCHLLDKNSYKLEAIKLTSLEPLRIWGDFR